ncbi:MAG: TadE family type IV pilus minor pilin [Oryzihumus sp.]
MVTAELAVVLPVVVAVLALSLWAFGLAVDQVRCVDAARAGARAAARGDPVDAVSGLVRRDAPAGATVAISVGGADVTVTVTAPERRLGGLVRAGWRPAATATGRREVEGGQP